MTESTSPAWLPATYAERLDALKAQHPGFIRLRRVVELSGLSKSTIWARAHQGSFPAPVRLGGNSTGWKEAEVLAWIESRPAAVDCVA